MVCHLATLNSGLPIAEVEYPAIAICNPGMFEKHIQPAFLDQVLSFLKNYKHSSAIRDTDPYVLYKEKELLDDPFLAFE